MRDGASVIGLAKYLKTNSESAKEVAAMVRVLCLGASCEVNLYACDPTIYKPIRRFNVVSGSKGYTKMTINKPTWKLPDCKIIAVPLSSAIAIALNKTSNNQPAGFSYGDMDVTWTMIPIRQSALLNRWVLEYIIAHLDSCLWNGVVNWNVVGTYLDDKWENYLDANLCLIPNANSVRIPGPTNVMLVLIDCTDESKPAQIMLGGSSVPVWNYSTNSKNTPIPVNLTQIWQNRFKTGSEAEICNNCASAFNEMCVKSSGDTCGRALSLASEMMLGNYPGMMADIDFGETPGTATTDYGTTPKGSWAWKAGSIDKKDGTIKANEWLTEDRDGTNTTWREKLIGFNFSVSTPYHRIPTGLTKINYVANTDTTTNKYTSLSITWSGSGFADDTKTTTNVTGLPGYQCSSTSSLMRLAIACGLVDTTHQGYIMKSGMGMCNWLNMCGVAIALSTSNFLTSNDIDLRTWMGWKTTVSVTHASSVMQKMLDVVTANTVSWVDMEYLIGSEAEWDWSEIKTYYTLDPLTNNKWGSYSPWPVHAFIQWAEKLQILPALPGMALDNYVTQTGDQILGLILKHTDRQWKSIALATPDFVRYAPQLYAEIVGSKPTMMGMWIDQWAYDSCIRLNRRAETQYLTSNTPAMSIFNQDYITARPNLHLITGSRLNYHGAAHKLMRTSPIQYPDPPGFEDFWRAARDYVIIPALAGGAGFVTGGPVGAVAGAGGALVSQIAHDIHKGEIKQLTSTPQIESLKAIQHIHKNNAGLEETEKEQNPAVIETVGHN